MSLRRLAAALEAAGVAAGWQDVRDAVWLAALSAPDTPPEPTETPGSIAEPEPDLSSGPRPAERPPPPEQAPAPAPPPPARPADPPSPEPAARTDPLGVYLPAAGTPTCAGAPIRILDTSRPLSDQARIVRELRPVKRRVAARGRYVLDEDATAERIAETGLWDPVLVADLGRWLDLNIVVEDSASMAIWEPTTRKLVALFGRLGAFRRVSAWYLDAQGGGAVLRAQPGAGVAHDPREILDPTGRSVTVLLSDGVGAGWRSGLVDAVLAQWATAGPVAIWQALPPRLWRRTTMRPLRGSITAARPGQPAAEYRVRLGHRAPGRDDGTGIPVVNSGDGSLAGWARLLISGGSTTTAVHLIAEPAATRPRAASATAGQGGDPAAVIARFRADSSASAMRLAVYFSAMPLTLDTMRIAQQVMLPDSGPSHLAEVFLGGLLRRAPAGFDFVPGVREALLSAITRAEALAVLGLVAEGSALPLAQSQGFRAVLADPQRSDVRALDALDRPFAMVARTVLFRLGGAYAELVAPDRRAPTTAPADLPDAGAYRLYQPILFLGIGGTGCKVGAELERRLRADLCGPDGTGLLDRLDRPALPFELPRCTQFVYIDLSADELAQVRRNAVPGPECESAARRTRRLVSDLLSTDLINSAEVAQLLRINLDGDTVGWLPPKETDPRIGPLTNGAGQLPMVARSVLFENLRRDPDTARRALVDSVADINGSVDDLRAVSGGTMSPVDPVIVFVAFSVAGGTGAGLFYDYLHLVADIFQRSQN